MASRGNPHLWACLQRGYVLFGMEWDADVDDWAMTIHIWPITIEFSIDYIRIP